MAVASPRVIEIATGEKVTPEALGGVEVGSRLTGQIDLAVETEGEAFEALRAFLSYLPSNATDLAPRTRPSGTIANDPDLASIVPVRRSRTYDVRKLLMRLLDDATLLELKPKFGAGLLTALGRIDGWPVGIIASQPMYEAGALTPAACDKATRLVLLCDAYGLPIVVLQDTPGFMVGPAVEHQRILSKAMMFTQALLGAQVPKIGVVVRKAYGLAFFSLGGSQMGMDFLAAWPTAEISFMDPLVGANVLAGGRATDANGEHAAMEIKKLAEQMTSETDPMGPARLMALDEVIDPAETRRILAEQLQRLQGKRRRCRDASPLATWPTCW
jgi:acetyl-CoA carboxylase carboxyltransferase component